jgi:regulator of protease activity HflC (stomatin/prohibitin superfamily)
LIVILVLLVILIVRNIVVVPQAKAYVVERLGCYHTTWEAGLHVKFPFIDRIARKCSLKEQIFDTPESRAITKDNVSLTLDAVIYFYVTNPERYTYGVEHPLDAINNLTATTMRNLIGSLELDQCLTSRDTINQQMCEVLDLATDPWGIKVTRVELKNLTPPHEIQDAMEKQVKAERERREAILQAEGTKQSQILVAEGEKASVILRADAEKYSRIAAAEADAEVILKTQKARADGIRMLKEAAPDDYIVRLQALDAFAKAADGQATKIIVPSEIASLAGLGVSVKNALSDDAPKQ